MKVGILTLGCKVNMYESEYVTNLLKDNGFSIGNFNEKCDIYIINTCTVTNNADSKSRKMINRAIKNNPDACVVAMGCFIEANKEYLIPGLDIVIGNKDKSRIVELINKYFEKKRTIINLYNKRFNEFEDMHISKFPGRTRAFVKIQDGCDNFCSYCIIPFVRGKCRSKDKEKVIKEVESLVNNNYKEIVLTGIHTGSYGIDKEYSFADLLKELIKIKNLKRLRISSIEVTELSEEVLEIIKKSNIIVDHLHIPIQAGSNEILKLMNRKYDLDFYTHKINEIKKIRPNIAISTDVIVGFPGEDEKLFLKTMETCNKIKFSKIHVFPYSKRIGTKAEKLPNHLPNDVKKKRAKELIELSKTLEIEYAKKFLNQELDVLIEEYKDGYSYGHTSNFLHIKIKKKIETNTFYKTNIKEIKYPYCIGE